MGVDIETYRGRIGTFKFAFGTDVVTVDCLVNFSHGLKTIGSLAFIGLLLIMAGIESNPGPKIDDDWKDVDKRNTIKVTGIPSHVDENYLVLVFKNAKKQGGGKVKTAQLDRQTNTALIEFEDPNGVNTVLKKRPIRIADTEVEVTALAENESCTVEVKGFAMNDSIQELLELYFEDVAEEEPVETKIIGDGKALVTFESIEVAKRMVGKDDHVLSQEKLTVSFFDNTKELDSDQSVQSKTDDNGREEASSPSVESGSELSANLTPIKTPLEKTLSSGAEQTFESVSTTANEPACSEILQTSPVSTESVYPEQDLCHQSSIETNTPLMSETVQNESECPEQIPSEESTAKHIETKQDERIPPLEPISTPDHVSSFEECSPSETLVLEQTCKEPVFSHLLSKEQSQSEVKNADQQTAETVDSEFGSIEDQSPKSVEQMDDGPEMAETDTSDAVVEDKSQSQEHVYKEKQDLKSETLTGDILSDKTDENPADQDMPEVNMNQIEVVINETEQSESDRRESCDEIETQISDANEVADQFTIHEILERLKLEDKYPEKITVHDVLLVPITNRTSYKISDVPWILLRQIIAVQSNARNTCLNDVEIEEEGKESDIHADEFDFIDDTATSNELSPLDIFNITIQCCDNMLKQILYKKLYLCKIAVPFVHIDRLSLKAKISIWPLRSIVVSNKRSIENQELKSNETELLEIPGKTVTFARLGRTQFSKSYLINCLLSDQIQNTFFNGDCPLGFARRSFSNGNIEMFCLPSAGITNEIFHETVTFFNMRGDMGSDFQEDVITFISKMSDTLVLVSDMVSINQHVDAFSDMLSRFPSVILLLENPLSKHDKTNLKTLKDNLRIPLKLIGSYKGPKKKNSKEIVANVTQAVVSLIEKPVPQTLENRLDAITTGIDVDEQSTWCKDSKRIASDLFDGMSKGEEQCKLKESVTPVNYIYSQKLGALIKRLYRLKNVTEIGTIEEEIKSLRAKQLENVSDPMKAFINIVTDNACAFNYVFGWLSYFLERQKRAVLPKLNEENISCWNKLNDLKKKGLSHSDPEMKMQIALTETSQKLIEDASFGIEHLFREVGHIYESVMIIHKNVHPTDLHVPPYDVVVDSVASLVAQGQPFEIVDGDNFYMPTHWVFAVLEKVSNKIDGKAVLALSVLGLQSSGKSTLLNAMFGSQFPVKSGRCTRGVHIQLLPCTSMLYDKLPFEYILVIDTEGLRAPEINPNRRNHDNELSTLITGLGDVTFLNIMGENTSEIRDILQVVVHAFLRLKLVTESLDIGKSFYLLHQNVVDLSASENMRTGLQVLTETLDTVTKEAAETEGITDITTFNQVIEFDMTSNVWYLPNFWQGNPPMARVNCGYSDRLVGEKMKLLDEALSKTTKSYQKLNDIALHMQDLWKGVLTEDFVYSFRNSLEIKAYVQLEETLKDILIQLENDVDEERIQTSQKEFSKCEKQTELQAAFDEINIQIQKALADKESVAKKCLKEFFEDNEYKDTIIQWEEFSYNRIRLLCSELEDNMKLETKRLRDQKAVYILTSESSKEHEKELYDRSLLVAKETKGKNLSEQEIEQIFEETWKSILSDIINVGIANNTLRSVRDCIIKCLFETIFSTEKMILKTELEKKGIFPHDADNVETGNFQDIQISCLKGSFTYTCISIEDVSFSSQNSNVFNLDSVEEKVNYLFEKLDLDISRCCQSNMELTQREVKMILLKAKHEVQLIRKGNTDFTLKTTSVVKLFIHISFYIKTKFDEHNASYQKSHGVQARLEMYKLQVKEHFMSYIKDRKAEETAAKQIVMIVETTLRELIKERLPVTVKSALLNSLTHLKFHLILEMLEEMTANDDFDSFIVYINNPKLFADKWITKKAENFLFDSQISKYSELASGVVAEFFNALKESAKSSTGPEVLSVENWLKKFTSNFQKYTFPLSAFRDVLKILDNIADKENFLRVLQEQLNVSEAKLKNEFEEQSSTSVTWCGQNPYESLIQKAWGCTEQCAFCGEPCAKDSNHQNIKHYCLQHRLKCCKGVRNRRTEEASITSCSYDVQSDQRHHCSVFDYLCNPNTRKQCDIVWHNYKDYRTFLPEWDIEPNPNMQDCGKFWLWFVATYKHKLADHYEYDVSNIPPAWNSITKEEALDNLRRIYTGSS